jgi:hypothetical protein
MPESDTNELSFAYETSGAGQNRKKLEDHG